MDHFNDTLFQLCPKISFPPRPDDARNFLVMPELREVSLWQLVWGPGVVCPMEGSS